MSSLRSAECDSNLPNHFATYIKVDFNQPLPLCLVLIVSRPAIAFLSCMRNLALMGIRCSAGRVEFSWEKNPNTRRPFYPVDTRVFSSTFVQLISKLVLLRQCLSTIERYFPSLGKAMNQVKGDLISLFRLGSLHALVFNCKKKKKKRRDVCREANVTRH